MITNQDKNYRKIHGVVPSLDNVNNDNPYKLLPKTPVRYTRFTVHDTKSMAKSMNIKKAAKGLGEGMSGVLHMGSGNFGYGVGKVLGGALKMGTGIADPTKTSIAMEVAKSIKETEYKAWKEKSFLTNFEPAFGRLGDVYYKDGSCDDFHVGNGYKFFDNGDYFEGYWNDGEISWGVYIFNNGERYFGGFSDGYKHGHGITLYTDGSVYWGNYYMGKRHDVGGMWYKDGAYVGDFYNDVEHGYGACKYDNGVCFMGDFYNGQPNE